MTVILKKVVEYSYYSMLIAVIFLSSCSSQPERAVSNEKVPLLSPDYSGIMIPPNIAPINFKVKDQSGMIIAKFSNDSGFSFEVTGNNGTVKIPENSWKKLLSTGKGGTLKIDITVEDETRGWTQYKTITDTIGNEPIDPYLWYRVLYPGYESWNELAIDCRDLRSFSSHVFIDNSIIDKNCINCHAFNNGHTDDFLFHIRGTHGGTYFYRNGEFSRVNLKTGPMSNGAVYPRWHPGGRFVAFSTNKIIQQFHSADNKKIEVSDLDSEILLYDTSDKTMQRCDTAVQRNFMDTWPEWSPDGKYLYFCRTFSHGDSLDLLNVRYSLFRRSFDENSKSFGKAECVTDLTTKGKSILFPRLSPDGKFIIVTVADYGSFPIWHKEADLYLISVSDGSIRKMDLNSDFAESYHSFSSNGRWLVFSSKRDDGITARPYLAYIRENGQNSKPFILPQKDPDFFKKFPKSYNIPEFSTFDIKETPGQMRRITSGKSENARWSGKQN